jgi:uncharacterized protein
MARPEGHFEISNHKTEQFYVLTGIFLCLWLALFPAAHKSTAGSTGTGRPVVHFEIGCRDVQKTQEFYGKLFDWKISPMGPSAATIAPEVPGIGGHITALGHEPQHYTIFYVDVEDVAESLKKAESLGAKTLVPPVNIPTGTFAWMQDPEGNTVGLWKSKP